MKQMHAHKINQRNLSGLQMDIFNRIQTERQRAFFYTNERTALLLSTGTSGKKLLSNSHGSPLSTQVWLME